MKHLIQLTKNKKTIIVYLISFIIIAAIAVVIVSHERAGDRLPVALKAIKTTDGWSYEIAVDGKPFIRQSTIPAIDGNISFATKEEALLVGNHALAKLKTGKMPQVTVSELKEWGIIKNR